jgi:chromosome segregation ATPase
VSARDPLHKAVARIQSLEAELSALKNESELLRERHEAQLEALKAQHRAQLDSATVSTRAQIENARMQTELMSMQMQAEAVEQDRESYLERLNALAAELSEEIDVLLSFSRETATAFYQHRVERETEVLRQAEESHRDAKRTLARKEAEAQASGQRTITQMAEIDMAINLARAEAQGAGVAVRDAKARLETLVEKLARARA